MLRRLIWALKICSLEINSKEVQKDGSIPDDIPESIKAALIQFMQTLSETSNNSEVRLKMGEVKATSSIKAAIKMEKASFILLIWKMSRMERESSCLSRRRLNRC